MKDEKIKKIVKDKYAKIAQQKSSCCGPVSSCCGSKDTTEQISKNLGYAPEEIRSVPEGANLGLGCGNPVALASIKAGDTVLDLGSGAGFDCFLAAPRVGEKGRVIGVDMTPDMVAKANENLNKGGYANVEFRLGEIESLPVEDDAVNIVISNCVINLSPDKLKVFQEVFRVLKPGGKFFISDIVLRHELPEDIKQSVEAYVGCVAGAILKDQYIDAIKGSGFQNIKILDESSFPIESIVIDPGIEGFIKSLDIPREKAIETVSAVLSIKVSGEKPAIPS